MVRSKNATVKSRKISGNFLAVQWLGLHNSTARGMGSVPLGELRSFKLHGAAKKKKKKKKDVPRLS